MSLIAETQEMYHLDMRLATLPEGAGCFLCKVNFKKYILFKNGCFKAEKLVKNVKVAGFYSPYVLEMKEINFVCRTNRLLLELLLVKCYDNKNFKSP